MKLVGLLVLLSCGSAGGEQVRGRKDGSMHPKEASLGERRVQEDLDNMLVEDVRIQVSGCILFCELCV